MNNCCKLGTLSFKDQRARARNPKCSERQWGFRVGKQAPFPPVREPGSAVTSPGSLGWSPSCQ